MRWIEYVLRRSALYRQCCQLGLDLNVVLATAISLTGSFKPQFIQIEPAEPVPTDSRRTIAG
jgi:hypothetical protein